MRTYAEPTSMQEYLHLYQKRQKISGTGMDTTIYVPCPFCAEPDFVVYNITEVREAMSRDNKCRACGRGCKAVFTDEEDTIIFEVYQTSGPDQPLWLIPRMPRTL